MALDYAPAPVRDAIAEQNPDTGKMMLPRVWVDWFAALGVRVDKQAFAIDSIHLPGVGGSIGVTPIPVPTSSAATYRLSYYLRITVPATVSCKLEVVFGWVDGGVTCSQTFPAVTGNTTQTTQSNSIIVKNDNNGLLTYAVNYISDAAGTLKYNIDILAEQI